MSNFFEKKEKKKKKKSKIILATNKKRFFIEKSTEKSELLAQIAKVSRQKIETTDQKIHNFQLTKIGEKRKVRMTTTDFISIRGQQNFKDDAEINPVEIKIENGKIQNMIEKFKKPLSNSLLKGYVYEVLFKMKQKKIFVTRNRLIDAKYSLINGKLYQTTGVINLNKIKNWNKIKKSSR